MQKKARIGDLAAGLRAQQDSRTPGHYFYIFWGGPAAEGHSTGSKRTKAGYHRERYVQWPVEGRVAGCMPPSWTESHSRSLGPPAPPTHSADSDTANFKLHMVVYTRSGIGSPDWGHQRQILACNTDGLKPQLKFLPGSHRVRAFDESLREMLARGCCAITFCFTSVLRGFNGRGADENSENTASGSSGWYKGRAFPEASGKLRCVM